MKLQPSRTHNPSFNRRRFVLSILTVSSEEILQPIETIGLPTPAPLLTALPSPPLFPGAMGPADGCNFFYCLPVTIDSMSLSRNPVELRLVVRRLA